MGRLYSEDFRSWSRGSVAVVSRFCCENVRNFIKLRFSESERVEEVNISSRLLGTLSRFRVDKVSCFWSRNMASRALNSRYSLILVLARQDTMSEEQ